ncbi:hypothetical protein COS31_03850 [Candidatus Roizmanbacteria bacterium CG02_land_8_20_14_3_00_36_15]|uniref:DUF2079 domain-containing protein n=2 Tax=Candidatus Roizmaniibacteriota TaxID=1752723 RepID=A0A2M8KKK2_9BACT|nr:MAG: hypothetical protein COS51_02675 [Candidatus Roizmanbacteria bacterium CG03_land_8_20_14_0_80_36_21]PIV37540.1 MAG: hypothetical protein COS31_03850 [Candidatus Roizmanbacteria bacterium CG02_land_8_20_14_3_00_36_15]PIY70434.1 MAG: hypothetical protein COY89_01330 [Candidatus Roizmanbacteria bacterium CG_4_10_14_0_8_um_filter_36_36]PJA53825.1 MAG: hypothetical protein CO166_00425 [Candidatus Roizmanbacteria bacterium CG_4_9_14_3_um_filter_36_11]PJC81323.1 MAG: hypothetical protein CO007
MKYIIKSYGIEVILGLLIVGYIILFSYLSIHRMLSLNSHYYDLGIMNQVVYNTSRGHFLEMTNQEFRQNMSRLAIHFDPILVLFTPFYWFYPNPAILLVGQTVILALGGLAIYLISEKLLKNKLMGLVFCLSFLFFFPVQRATLFDFHGVLLATSFFLWAYYFLLKKKDKLVILFILLSLLTKEHVGMIVFLFGIYIVLFYKNRRLGLIIGLSGLVFFITSFFIIIPYFRQHSHFALQYFDDFGDTPTKVIINIIKKPGLVINYLTRTDTKNYLYRLIYPYFPFFFFSPLVFLISLPELAINILSSNPNMRSIYFHYNSLIVPFLVLSAVNGAARIKKYRWSIVILALFIYMSYVSIRRYNPLPLKLMKEPYRLDKLDQKKLFIIYRWKNILAGDKYKVATTPKLAPFFTSRRYYYNFLYDPAYISAKVPTANILSRINKYQQADYVIINKDEIGSLDKDNLPVVFYKHLLTNKSFKKVFEEKEGIEVYKKL